MATGPGGSVTRTATVTPVAAANGYIDRNQQRHEHRQRQLDDRERDVGDLERRGGRALWVDELHHQRRDHLHARGHRPRWQRDAHGHGDPAAMTATLTATLSGSNTVNISWTDDECHVRDSQWRERCALGVGAVHHQRDHDLHARGDGAGGSVTRTATVSPLPSATLTATLSGNNTANVSWTTSNATSVTLNGASVALSGSASLHHQRHDDLHARGHGAGWQRDAHGNREPAAIGHTYGNASAEATPPTSVGPTSNATSVTLNGASVALSGSASYTIGADDHLHARGHRPRWQRDAHGYGDAGGSADGHIDRDPQRHEHRQRQLDDVERDVGDLERRGGCALRVGERHHQR